MGTTYVTVYYLIPNYLLLKKYFWFTLYSIYTLIFTAFAVVITMFGSFIFLSNFNVKDMPPMSRNFVFILILIFLVVGIVSFVSLLNHNFKTLSRNKALENKILDTQLKIKEQELEYLKKQIHPHFLFNSLNTIYGFSLKQSEQTPDIILKLSNLLDYILYKVQKKEVFLAEEILHIEEYVSLEQIRFQDTLQITVDKNNIPKVLQLPPMLFLPFVENAFKHGAIVDGNLSIAMSFSVINNDIEFQIINTIKKDVVEKQKLGIGLHTIEKRLDLLYPESYKLTTVIANGLYTVNLKIHLDA